MSPTYPWHQSQWSQLAAAHAAGRLPHAVLLRGPRGLGKRLFADALAALALCRVGDDGPCGECRDCVLYKAGNHPDLMRVGPEEGKQTIQIARVREFCAAMALSSSLGGLKLAIIDPADGLTIGAANSLLKTLEEPPGGTLMILVSEQSANLPATIRSRCQNVPFAPPPRAVALEWLHGETQENWPLLLEFAAGAPLAALALADSNFEAEYLAMLDDLAELFAGRADPVAVAAAWQEREAAATIDWLQRLLGGAIRTRLGGGEGELAHNFTPPALRQSLAGIKLQKLFEYSDQLATQARRLGSPVNAQLAIESVLLPWAGHFASDIPGSPIP